MRNLLPSSLCLARTNFPPTENKSAGAVFANNSDDDNKHARNTNNRITCAPAMDEENDQMLVCLDDGRMVRARCAMMKKDGGGGGGGGEEETNSILLKDTEEEDEDDEDEESESFTTNTGNKKNRNAVSVERLPELRATFVALECGELLLVNDEIESKASTSAIDVERVADVPGGCVSAKFSPDGQMCAVLTKSGKILIMNGDFYLLSERRSCLEEDEDHYEDEEEEEEQEAEMIKSGTITWRNDGESFCVYCTTSRDGKNHLRTYSRDKLEILGRGDVEHDDDETGPGRMCENAAIAWQPRGALIAVSGVVSSSSSSNSKDDEEKSEDIPCVVFYEKNGLRRSSLFMRGGFQGSTITHLSWSVDSLTLAISTRDKEKLRSAVSIWTRGNANWTCKRSIEYNEGRDMCTSSSSSSSSSKYAVFDAIHPNTFRIVSTNGKDQIEVSTQTFVWEDCTSSDLGTAAVIDGDILKLTPFSRCVVPPPMCDHSLRFPTKISEVAWRPNVFRQSHENDDDDEICFVSLHDGKCKVVRVNESAEAEELFDERDGTKSFVDKILTLPFSSEKRDEFRSYCWIGANTLACVSSINESTIVKIELDEKHSAIVKTSVMIELEKSVRERVVTKLAYCCGVNDNTEDGLLVAFVVGEKTPLIFSTSDAKQVNIAAASTSSEDNVIMHALQRAKALANNQIIALYSNGDLVLFRFLGSDDSKRLLLMKNVDSFEAFYEDEDKTWVKSRDAEGKKQYYKTVSSPNAIACVSRDSKLRVVRLSSSNTKSNAVTMDQLSKSLESQMFFNNMVDPVASRRNWKDVSGDGKTRLGELAFDSLHGKMRAAMRPDDADFATASSSLAGTVEANFVDMAKRTVERGSRIVAIPPGSCTVVLQQPRGNLEIVAPKALVLPSIAKSLKMRHFKTAFRLCAKERVDLNVLVDYDFPSSIEQPNADELVRGLERPEHVMELLEALRVGDAFAEDGGYMRKLCENAYAECPDKKHLLEDLGVQKVRRTCEAIRASISNLYTNADGTSRWSLAMLTSYACGTGSFLDTLAESNKKDKDILSIKAAKRKDLADALQKVAEVRAYEIKDASNKAISRKNASASSVAAANDVMNSDSSDADETEFIGAQFTKQTVSAARMLKHLLFLTNDRELFDAALSTGDLAIAHLVAMNSQAMDPGEFMPELQHLHEMREFERQATISERLEMWKDAAKFWLKDKSLEKASNVAAKHGLFPYLHELCEEENGDDSAETRKVITKYHARYLESVVNRAEDAGVAFLKCGEYESALRCFTGVSSASSSSSSSSSKSTGSGSSSWRSGFIVAKEKLKFSDEEMMKLASETCKNLEQSSNDYVSAAVVALDYLNDVERAVANFALANKWRDAKLTCFSKNRSDLFETTVFPECVVGATKLLEHFEDVQTRSDKYRERLIGLQERRKLYKKTFASVEEGRMRPRRASNLNGSEDDEYDDIKDNISEMNSEFSNVSGYSLYATSTQFGDGSAISQQSSSRWSASTVGGRRNKKSRKNKNKKNKNGLRAGGPTEERDLSSHVITDVRVSEEKLEECAEICEILIASDNSSDAKVLQNAASVAIEKCKLMRVAARESLKQLIEEKEKEEEYIMLVSSSANNNGALPPELMERKREIEADLKTMRESMNANAKDDVDVVSFKWSSIRTASK